MVRAPRAGGYVDPMTLPPRPRPVLTLAQFRQLEEVLRAAGYGDMIAWSENLRAPRDCRAFAKEAIYVICNSGMRVTIANAIYWRCIRALARGQSATTVFGHPGKAAAIDHIWTHRKILFDAYQIAENKLAHCATLPFVGPVTRHHLAKNLGINTVSPTSTWPGSPRPSGLPPGSCASGWRRRPAIARPPSTPSCGAPALMDIWTRANT